jgi:predicted dehydrogenase
MSSLISRRGFLRRASLAGVGLAAARPLAALGAAPGPGSGIRVAGIGVGGMGGANLRNCAAAGASVTALCDVDLARCGGLLKAFPSAEAFTDYRVMLERKGREIDAVVIATPDHTHALIAMACMRAGKHVYVQKPMAYDVVEARRLREFAREAKVATQMGNQGHSGEGLRQITEWIEAGLIGEVREVHAWTNRPTWPQDSSMARPKDTPALPEGLDWDLWIGPAPLRAFHPAYHPWNWRGWWDFGTGSLGDMGCHILDPVVFALRLGSPVSVEASVPTFYEGRGGQQPARGECYPRSSIVRYRFPARASLPSVELTWWDGGLMPGRPAELEDDMPFGDGDGGCLFVGTKGKLVCGCYGSKPRLLSRELRDAAKAVARSMPRIPGNTNGHEADWLRACKGGVPACSNFEVAGPLTETVLMGNLAIRFPGRKLAWDGGRMEVTNDPEANRFVHRTYREGFSL